MGGRLKAQLRHLGANDWPSYPIRLKWNRASGDSLSAATISRGWIENQFQCSIGVLGLWNGIVRGSGESRRPDSVACS